MAGVKDVLIDQFRADIMEDITGDFELGGTVAYIVPNEFVWTFDEAEVESTLYRVVNCAIAYRVDGRAAYSP